MKQTNTLLGLGLGFLCAVAPVFGQSSAPSFDFKFRAGLTAGDLKKDFQDNKLMGLAVSGSFPGVLGGSLLAEVGFDYAPGRGRDNLRQGGPVYYNPAAPTTTYNGQTLRLDMNTSGDIRKEGMQGFSFRAAYSQPWGVMEGLTWHAGATLDAYKVYSEVTLTLIPVYGTGTGTKVPAADGNREYYEGAAVQWKGTKLNLGAYAGATLVLTPNHKLELNLRNIGYTHREYTPFTYSGKAAGMSESTHRGWALEIGLAMKI